MSEQYRLVPLRQLKDQQTRFAPRDQKVAQLDRAETLLSELKDDKRYPYEYIYYRITGFRPEADGPPIVLDGADLRADLQLFLHDLAMTVEHAIDEATEPVLTVQEVGRRYNVSNRTISRWRKRGLVARRYVINGRVKIGFLESSVARFVSEQRARVERGARFRQLTDDERDEIIRRARRLASVGRGRLVEIARRIARKMDRSTETIRMIIKKYDVENPDRPILTSPPPGHLDDESKAKIYQRYLQGVSVENLVSQFKRTRSSIYRIINEMRAARILSVKLEFMPHPSFDDPSMRKEILGPMPALPEGKAPRRSKPPKGLPPYLASLYETPLLTREQESHLFRKMNYLKYRASLLRDRVDKDIQRAKTTELDEIERLQEQALEIKNQIISSNLRLVVSIAKRHVNPTSNFFELVSDGNMSLIRAVEKFDFSRGNKFSTYASWAIMKNFARTIPEENYRRDRFVTGHEEMFESAPDTRVDEHEYEAAQRRSVEAVKGMLGRLDERERRIIVSRFGIDGNKEQTLEQLGRELGITKERVRQIESRAQDKLFRIAKEQRLDLPIL